MSNERKLTPQEAYAKKYKKQYKIDCITRTEQDIIQKLDSVPNKAGYIKKLIRDDIVRNEKGDAKMRVSYECSEIIEELKSDIAEFGGNAPAYGLWQVKKFKVPFSEEYSTVNLLVNYLLGDDAPQSRELKDCTAILSDLKTLLKIFEEENRII